MNEQGEMSDDRNEQQPAYRRTAKVGHKKARTGCLTCRSRKVKCDESSPECSACRRLGLHCEYSRPAGRNIEHQRSAYDASAAGLDDVPARPIDDDTRMELRLFHAWMSRGLADSSLTGNGEWRRIWMIEMPQLALQYSNVLYAMLALSATQLVGHNPEDRELANAGLKYWSLALVEQQLAVSRIPKTNVEALSFAALLISINSFAMIRDRELEPYVAPVYWLQISRGAWEVLPNEDEVWKTPNMAKVIEITSPIWINIQESVSIAPCYEVLLRHSQSSETFEDLEIYRTTLAKLTSFRQAVLAGEPAYHHARRICIFAEQLPSGFVGFLEEQRPRALIILARFFALTAHSGALAYFGDFEKAMPTREVQAIAQAVPQEWQGLMVEAIDETAAAA